MDSNDAQATDQIHDCEISMFPPIYLPPHQYFAIVTQVWASHAKVYAVKDSGLTRPPAHSHGASSGSTSRTLNSKIVLG